MEKNINETILNVIEDASKLNGMFLKTPELINFSLFYTIFHEKMESDAEFAKECGYQKMLPPKDLHEIVTSTLDEYRDINEGHEFFYSFDCELTNAYFNEDEYVKYLYTFEEEDGCGTPKYPEMDHYVLVYTKYPNHFNNPTHLVLYKACHQRHYNWDDVERTILEVKQIYNKIAGKEIL